jgi:hypothetical protein
LFTTINLPLFSSFLTIWIVATMVALNEIPTYQQHM